MSLRRHLPTQWLHSMWACMVMQSVAGSGVKAHLVVSLLPMFILQSMQLMCCVYCSMFSMSGLLLWSAQFSCLAGSLCMTYPLILLSCQLQSPAASVVMRRSIQGMLEELEYNLWEHILHRLVDYGHTFSPEIEMAALNGDEAMLLHGEAVNIDMALTTQVRLVL